MYKTRACTWLLKNSLLILTNKLLSKTKKSSQNTSKLFIWSPFLFSSRGSCSLLWRAVDLNISVDALSLTPSLSQALFTLLLGLPSLQLNMDVWFTGRRSVTDHLPLLPSPSFQLHASRPTLAPNLMENIVHQLQALLHNYFLQCINIKPSLGLALTFTPTVFAYSGFCSGPWGAVCCEVAYFLRDSLFAFHMLWVYQEESHEGPSDYKKQR